MKKTIVTGASGNLGKAVIGKFLEEGYHVTGTVIPGDPAPLDISHPQFEKAVVDLLNEEDAGKFVAGFLEKHQTADAAVLTVGGFAMGKLVDTKTPDIINQIRLNFETAYNIARPLFAQMLAQGTGRIFLTGSRPGLDSTQAAGMTAYSLGKSLVFRLAELMNAEAKGTDVVTTVIVPGTIDTPQNRKAMPNADFSAWTRAEHIAGIIHYYCTDNARTIREPLVKAYNNS